MLSELQRDLMDVGFQAIGIETKEESREVIKQWLPGSKAEDFVVSANITAVKRIGI